MDKEQTKQEFIKIAKQNISRDGIDKLLDYMQKTDFFDAPASSKFHSAFEGGLCLHSINVYNRFVANLKKEYGDDWQNKVSLESATIISLFHDICKTDYYKQEMRNIKEDGIWVQKPFYKVEDSLPYGHGEKSVYIINGFLRLTREEAMAINWHMGAFDPRATASSDLSDAYSMFPNAVLFHTADLVATYLDEK